MHCCRSFLARQVLAESLSPSEEDKMLQQLSVPAPDSVPICKALICLGRSAALTSTALLQQIAQLLDQPPLPPPEAGRGRGMAKKMKQSHVPDDADSRADDINELWTDGDFLFKHACHAIKHSVATAHQAKAARTEGASKAHDLTHSLSHADDRRFFSTLVCPKCACIIRGKWCL